MYDQKWTSNNSGFDAENVQNIERISKKVMFYTFMHQILSRLKSFSPLVLLGNLRAEKVKVWGHYFQNFKKLPEQFIFKTTVSDMKKFVR